jgi:hypothetical protein
MKKTIPFYFFVAISTILLNACSKSDASESSAFGNGPQDTVTNFMITLYNTADSINEVVSYNDPDGPGPKAPTYGGFTLKKNTLYNVSFRIEDATGSSPVLLHPKIKSNGKDYKICIGNALGINAVPTDSDGNLPIGLEQDLTTSSTTGSDNLNFTIKYQKGTKNGQCAPGVVYFTCNIPVIVN